MPSKKQKFNKKRLNWKVIAIAAAVIILAGAAWAQICFNKYVNRELERSAVFQSRTLMIDAMGELTDRKSKPTENNRLPEARLQFPAPQDEQDSVLYFYQKTDGDTPETISITTRDITEMGLNKLNGLTHEQLFEGVPEAQACSRGFEIRFDDGKESTFGGNMKQAGTKKLADGRTMHLWRDQDCGKGGRDASQTEHGMTDTDVRFQAMNDLEKYLLQAQSY